MLDFVLKIFNILNPNSPGFGNTISKFLSSEKASQNSPEFWFQIEIFNKWCKNEIDDNNENFLTSCICWAFRGLASMTQDVLPASIQVHSWVWVSLSITSRSPIFK